MRGDLWTYDPLAWECAEVVPVSSDGNAECGMYVLCMSSTGKYLLCGGRNRRLMAWKVQGHLLPLWTHKVHDACVTAVAMSTDGSCILTASLDCKVRVFFGEPFEGDPALESKDGSEMLPELHSCHTRVGPFLSEVTAIVLHEQGDIQSSRPKVNREKRYLLVVGTDEGTMHVYTLSTSPQTAPTTAEVCTLLAHQSAIFSLVVATWQRGVFLVSGSNDSTVKLWSMSKLMNTSSGWGSSRAFRRGSFLQGKNLSTMSIKNDASEERANIESALVRELNQHTGSVKACACASSRNLLITAGYARGSRARVVHRCTLEKTL
jgi:WD40 repeat protein